jgi:hypothetical protein
MEENRFNVHQQNQIQWAESALWRLLRNICKSKGDMDELENLQTLYRVEPVEVSQEGQFTRVCFTMYEHFSDYNSTYNAQTGEQMSWMFNLLADNLSQRLSEEECLQRAEKAAHLPEGAVMKSSGYVEQGGQAVFMARWGHQVDGVSVERDYIMVLVNGTTGDVFGIHRKWHEIDLGSKER